MASHSIGPGGKMGSSEKHYARGICEMGDQNKRLFRGKTEAGNCCRVTRFRRYYGPLRYPRRPSLSLAGVWLRGSALHHRVPTTCFITSTCSDDPGGPSSSDRSWDWSIPTVSIHPQRRRPSPSECRVGVHIGRFEACSTFTRITACRLAESPLRPVCLVGSDGFVTSTAAPIATGWSDRVAGWELHPLKTNTLPRAGTLGLTPRISWRTFPSTRSPCGWAEWADRPGAARVLWKRAMDRLSLLLRNQT